MSGRSAHGARLLGLAALALAGLGLGCGGDGGGDPGEVLWRVETDALDRVVLSAAGPSTDDLWVAGGGLGNGLGALLLHYDRGRPVEVATGVDATFWWVWVAPTGEVFAVGEGGTVVRVVDGAAERLESGTTAVLYGVWGTSARDVWIVGGDPFEEDETDVVLRFDGESFTRVPVPEPPSGVALFKVAGSAPDDVWMVGQRGEALHWDGAALERVPTGTRASLFTVWVGGAEDVWAVGGPPRAMLRWDGAAFVDADPFGVGLQLNGVAGNGDDLAVVGIGGVKWVREGGVWRDESESEPFVDLHAAWMGPRGEIVAVGGNFLAPGAPGSVRVGVVASRAPYPIVGE